MPSTNGRLTGGCMCGAVRYETAGGPDRVLHCHCRSCRSHTGAPMATLAVFKAGQVRFSGDGRKPYKSAPGVERAFCAACGTSLTWETILGDEGEICAIHISTFDQPDALPPDAHSFYPERISWFDVADRLPRHRSFVRNSDPLRHGPAGEAPSVPEEWIAGSPPDSLTGSISVRSAPMNIDAAKDLLEENIERLNGLGYRVRFETPDGCGMVLDGVEQPPVMLDDEDAEVDCTIRMSADDLRKLLTGSLNPTLAYTMGKLKVDGSMGVALKLASLLDE